MENKRIAEVLAFLEEHGLGYKLHTHPPLPTIELALEYWKDIVFECHKELAIHSLEHMLKQGKLSFASAERMERCLGLLPGSVSPLGLMHDPYTEELTKEHFPNGHRVKLFLDKDLKDAEKVSFHPCDNTASVVLSNEDFMRFLEIWGGEYEWLDVTAEV